MQSLERWDVLLFHFINGTATHPVLDKLFIWLTWLGSHPWIFIPLGVLAYFKSNVSMRKMLWLLIPLFILSDLIPTLILKPAFGRLRPIFELESVRQVMVLNPHLSIYGFPSNHASNISAIFIFLFLLMKAQKKYLPLMIIPLAVMYSRIYIGVHYPGDVLFGMLYGLFVGGVVYGVGRRLFNSPGQT